MSTSFLHELALTTDYGDIAQARRFAGRVLRQHGFAGPHDAAVLVVSELVANSLRHGGGGGWLRLSGTGSRLRIEVADHLDGPDEMTPGFGLALVDRLSEGWGVTRLERGKVVWCEVRAEGAPGGRAKLQYGHRVVHSVEASGR